jgi:subtilisin family serine protease
MGTSFATPLITGLVACLWQALPQKTAREIIQAVIQSGDKQAAPDDIYGYGVPDFVKAYQLLKGK